MIGERAGHESGWRLGARDKAVAVSEVVISGVGRREGGPLGVWMARLQQYGPGTSKTHRVRLEGRACHDAPVRT